MKYQKQILNKCLNNDIPAIVFQGSDSCAVEILQAAEAIYRKHGCSPEFLRDFHENVIENFSAYQQDNSIGMKLPDLTPSEKESFYNFENLKLHACPEEIKNFQNHLQDLGFTQTFDTTVSHGSYSLINDKEQISIVGKNGDYDLAITQNKSAREIYYYIFSNDPKYPERVGDYNSFITCITDIMQYNPLEKKNMSLNDISKKYSELGYENISIAIEKYTPNWYELNMSDTPNSKYTIKDIQIHSSGSKSVIGNLALTKDNNKLVNKIEKLRIHDRSTNKTEVLSVGDIDLSKQPAESLQGLLSGKQVEMTNTSGFKQMMGLNKTPAGWGLQVGKQVFSAADTSAEI